MKRRFNLVCGIGLAISLALTEPLSKAEPVQFETHDLELVGILARETFDEIFQPTNIIKIIKKFNPKRGEWDWTKKTIEEGANPTRFSYLIQPSRASLGLGDEKPSQKNSAKSSWFGSILNKAQRELNTLTQAGLLVGIVESEPAVCQEGNLGYRLNIDLSESSSKILDLALAFYIRICPKSLPEPGNLTQSEAAILSISLAIEPGNKFPGVDNPYVQEFVANQAQAWPDAIQAVFEETQVSLIHSRMP